MWTLYGGEEASNNDGLDDEAHALLILCRQDATMVLQTGQEIMELDQSGFATQGPTVFAANIGNDKFIVQVFACARVFARVFALLLPLRLPICQTRLFQAR